MSCNGPNSNAPSGHDGKCRGPGASPGGPPLSPLWNVHVANIANLLPPEELLQARSLCLFPLSFPATCLTERLPGLFHPSAGRTPACGGGGVEITHAPSNHFPCGSVVQPLNTFLSRRERHHPTCPPQVLLEVSTGFIFHF